MLFIALKSLIASHFTTWFQVSLLSSNLLLRRMSGDSLLMESAKHGDLMPLKESVKLKANPCQTGNKYKHINL